MKRRKPEISSEPGAGLLTKEGAPVPLLGVSIEAKVRDGAVLTTVCQRFRNAEKRPIEAVYSFPLEESSAVCGLEIELGGRTLKGMVEEREKAFEKYDEAMKEGDSAFLLDRFRSDVFLVSVGRLLPGEEALVRISTVSKTETWDKGLRLRIPTTISPKYVPWEQSRTADPAELEAICPPTATGRVPYGLSLSVDISSGSRILCVACPSHPVEVSVRGHRASVRLAGRDVQLDSDFVLNIEFIEPSRSGCIACRDGDGYALLVRMRPDLPAEAPQPRDVIFVIDRSGSMSGESIAEARAALLLGLKSLREGDRFDVIGFGSRCERLFGQPEAYTQNSADRAIAITSGWDADLGGTEILEPLRQAFQNAGGERLTSVLLLTDGEVGNEAEVVALASQHRKSARVFSFGIGRGASGSLIKGVARASGGVAEFIYPGERIEPKVMRQMARLSSSVLWGARLDWGILQPDAVTPSGIPAFSGGDELRFLCRVPRLEATRVRLLARNGSPVADCEVVLAENDLADDNSVALLLARGLIDDLETGDAQAGSRQTARRQKTTEKQILDIALKYQLASSKTSFIAVETRKGGDPIEPVALRRVPVALTSGWGGISAISIPVGIAGVAGIGGGTVVVNMAKMAYLEMKPLYSRGRPGQKPARAQADSFLELVALQKVGGSWVLKKKLADLAGASQAQILEELPESIRRPDVAGTLVALFLLWTEHVSREDEWKLIAEKALAWLEAEGVSPSAPLGRQEMIDWLGGQGSKGTEPHA